MVIKPHNESSNPSHDPDLADAGYSDSGIVTLCGKTRTDPGYSDFMWENTN